MNVTFAQWVFTIGIIVGLFVFDFALAEHRQAEFTTARAAKWITFYVAIACAFGLWVWNEWSSEFALQFAAGYLTEYSLSVDNLFVFLVILNSFQVPRILWHRVLLVGIAIALVLRAAMIAAGTTLINQFVGAFIIFGLFLLWTAWQVAREQDPEVETENRLIGFVRRIIPITEEYHGNRLVLRIRDVRHLTPLALVMVAIGSTDLMFALDSIPAILGLTSEGFLVFTANAFALMGLRQLFFLVQGLLDHLIYLSRGLAVILGFIGVKLILHAAHELWFPQVPEISTMTSLVVIAGVLLVTAVLSLVVDRRRRGSQDDVGFITDGEQHDS